MELTHRFTVPTGIEETWAHFEDIAGLATCFPGAQVTSVDGDTFAGSVKVKLGPIALVYNGSGTFVEKDDDAHRFVVDAKGKDKRGNGTAGAKVTLSMVESGTSTDVEVLTDLAITGKPAQFGRGVMQDVSDKLLGQFVGLPRAAADRSERVTRGRRGRRGRRPGRPRRGRHLRQRGGHGGRRTPAAGRRRRPLPRRAARAATGPGTPAGAGQQPQPRLHGAADPAQGLLEADRRRSGRPGAGDLVVRRARLIA